MSDEPLDERFHRFAESRDPRLRDELILDNQGLAIAFARRYLDRGVPRDDLEQVALEALVRSVDRFDPEVGVRFSTFAARTIDGALKQHFRDRTWQVHVPRRMRQLATAVRSATAELTQEAGRAPTPAEIAEHLGLDRSEVTLALDAVSAYRTEDIDRPGAAEPSVAEGADYEASEARVAAQQLLARLPDQEREIVELRFLEGLSQDEIGDRVGVSQMQVSRVLRRALGRLRPLVDEESTDLG